MKNPIIPSLNIPVRSIFCIGRNYLEHAKEMGQQAPNEPLVFLKPLSSICYTNSKVKLPNQSKDIHHEVELVLAIGKQGKNISKETALEHVAGFGIGIDFTARDLQKKAKEKGLPWSIAKGFDNFAPIGSFTPFSSDAFPECTISVSVNGEKRQHGTTSDMIFDVPTLISFLSTIFTLEKGDLIFTGTPEGVSSVKKGDLVEACIENVESTLTVTIA
ncbi:MAG: fumarylacetoacetate hydrolase family protein [Balneolaceae bacterium]